MQQAHLVPGRERYCSRRPQADHPPGAGEHGSQADDDQDAATPRRRSRQRSRNPRPTATTPTGSKRKVEEKGQKDRPVADEEPDECQEIDENQRETEQAEARVRRQRSESIAGWL